MVFSAIIEQKVGDTDIFHYICRAYMNKLPYHKMKKYLLTLLALPALAVSAQNPFLPLWEFIPDGEPYVFEDPDRPGEYRMYVYGSHDSTIDKYCGYEQVVWSAPVNDLTNWRYDGVTLKVTHDRDGKQLHEDGRGDMLYAPLSAPKPIRGQGAFLSDKEVESVVNTLKERFGAYYDEDIMKAVELAANGGNGAGGSSGASDSGDGSAAFSDIRM